MFVSNNWTDYKLIDSGDALRLESFGGFIFVRPDPVCIWEKSFPKKWDKAHAVYTRGAGGGGSWEFKEKIPSQWTINYTDLKFLIKPMGFKHMGVFPEQADNWDFLREKLKNAKSKKILNLFAYTGCASVAAASIGASVVHVDSSKSIINMAKENIKLNGLENAPVRFLVDDVKKFVQREIRRGNTYDGIILDPPSYGRGPKGETWKIEDELFPLLLEIKKLLSKTPLFVILNSYSTNLSTQAVDLCMQKVLGKSETGELCLKAENGDIVPTGVTSRWCGA
jgi:23S rRNA (cytosine1962-C5)-methyltransferase